MDRAIPTLFHGVPANNALQVRAQSGELLDLAALILVHGDGLARRWVEDTTFSRNKVFDVFDVRLEEALVLCVDLQHVTESVAGGLEHGRFPGGRVEGGPFGGSAGDLVGDQFAGKDTVSQTITGVAGDDVDAFLTLVLANVCHKIGLHSLARGRICEKG